MKSIYIDDIPTPRKDDTLIMGTVWDSKCKLIVPTDALRCPDCIILKENIRQKDYNKALPKPANPSKFTPNIHLSTDKLKKFVSLALEKMESRRKIASLTKKVQILYSQNSVSVNETHLCSIMNSESNRIQDVLPEDHSGSCFNRNK